MGIKASGFNNTADCVGEWFINENLDLAYLSVVASESIPSGTSTDVDSDPMMAMYALTLLHTPLRFSFMVREERSDARGAFFEVPAKHEGQKPILFGRVKPGPTIREVSKVVDEPPQFT